MIRLRVEPFSDEEMELVTGRPLGMNTVVNGLIWFGDGIPVGRVSVEQVVDIVTGYGDTLRVEHEWVPVEVVGE